MRRIANQGRVGPNCRAWVPVFLAAAAVVGCEGPRGPSGPPGAAAWDLNGNGQCDVDTEDLNGDGECTAADARGGPGDPGDPGAACWDLDASGTCEAATEDMDGDGDCTAADCRGAPGVAAWDLDGDGECDVATEDANGDGNCTVADARGGAGSPGVACWDLNANGGCDAATEDPNGDGDCDVADCMGLPGTPCWDLNGNGVCDAATEDANGDGGCDAIDCDATLATAEYVGSSEVCGACHMNEYQKFIDSGHPFKLNPVVGGVIQSNVDPASLGIAGWTNRVAANLAGVTDANLPYGLTWRDLSYVIGGWGWKARFMDATGQIARTGDGSVTPAAPVQYNLPNAELGLGTAAWGNWNTSGSATRQSYNCGPCHTTGYDPTASPPAGMTGLVGYWSQPGIHCEACHGPGSIHVATRNPADIVTDRSSTACGRCHTRGAPAGMDGVAVAPTVIEAKGGFVEHHEQFDELWNSKHRTLDCVDCHDPHDSTMNGTGVESSCASCHWDRTVGWASAMPTHEGGMRHPLYMPPSGGAHSMYTTAGTYPASWVRIECTDCHMSATGKSARSVGSVGDVHTHTFAIAVDPSVVYIAGATATSVTTPAVTLDFACASCHASNGPRTAGCRGCHTGGAVHAFPQLPAVAADLRAGTTVVH